MTNQKDGELLKVKQWRYFVINLILFPGGSFCAPLTIEYFYLNLFFYYFDLIETIRYASTPGFIIKNLLIGPNYEIYVHFVVFDHTSVSCSFV